MLSFTCRRLSAGRALTTWRTEFLAAYDHPDVSNGPTETST